MNEAVTRESQKDVAASSSASMSYSELPVKEVKRVYIEELRERYEVLDELGRGKFGVVKRGRSLATGKEWALKIVSRSKTEVKRTRQVQNEIEILTMLNNHGGIVSLHEIVETRDSIVIVTEILGGGHLFEAVLKMGTFSEKDAVSIVRQLLEALAFAHRFNVVHRDLKVCS
jgi:serine/threonine protein kinase